MSEMLPTINELVRYLRPQGDPTASDELKRFRWVPAWRSKPDQVMLYPTTLLNSGMTYLYRGQVSRYQPCLPSLTRRLPFGPTSLNEFSESERMNYTVSQIRILWFRRLLKSHPLMHWATSPAPMMKLVELHPELKQVSLAEAKLFVDDIALAQHYGVPTGFIDLTESVEVAAFFATHHIIDGRCVPASEGTGVIYQYSLPPSANVQSAADHLEWTSPVGLQPFPRPAEQWAWVRELTLS